MYTVGISKGGATLPLIDFDRFPDATTHADRVYAFFAGLGIADLRITVFGHDGKNCFNLPPDEDAEGTHFGNIEPPFELNRNP